MDFGKKKFREIDLFDSTSFLVWTFLNFLAHSELHSKPAGDLNENPFQSKFWVKSNSVNSDVNCGNHIYCEFGYFCIVLSSVILYQSFDNF